MGDGAVHGLWGAAKSLEGHVGYLGARPEVAPSKVPTGQDVGMEFPMHQAEVTRQARRTLEDMCPFMSHHENDRHLPNWLKRGRLTYKLMAHEDCVSIGRMSPWAGIGVGPAPIIEKEDLRIDTERLGKQSRFSPEFGVESWVAGGPCQYRGWQGRPSHAMRQEAPRGLRPKWLAKSQNKNGHHEARL